MTFKTLLVSVCLWMGMSATAQHGPADNPPFSDEESTENSVQVFAPNAFTPNGDTFNNHWKIFINGIDIYDFHLTIYDRSGQIVWESFDSEAEWDGNFGGNPAQAGIYVWMIDAKNATSDERHQFNGFITLLR